MHNKQGKKFNKQHISIQEKMCVPGHLWCSVQKVNLECDKANDTLGLLDLDRKNFKGQGFQVLHPSEHGGTQGLLSR